MKAFRPALLALICAALTGCATYSGYAPKLEKSPPKSTNGVTLMNGNTGSAEQIFFSDGITTMKGRFSEFTKYLIAHYAQESTEKSNGKWLEITILSISCSGSFLTNCNITASALTGHGNRLIFETENTYGYGALPTASKTLEHLAEKMRSDRELNKYIFQ